MKLAFSTISCPDYTIDEVAAAAARHDFDGVELYALDGAVLSPELLVERRAELTSALGSLPVVCINSFATLHSADDVARAAAEAAIRSTMESAAALGCSKVKAFGGEIPHQPSPTVFDAIAASIERVAEHGRSLGVGLVVETHDGFSKGATLRELLDRVGRAGMDALWDVHHPYRMGESAEETDRLIGDRVVHVHVKDAVRDGEGWDYRPLGDGELPVREVIRALARRGYDGYLSIDWEKMWHPELAGPEVVLPQYRAKLAEYVAE